MRVPAFETIHGAGNRMNCCDECSRYLSELTRSVEELRGDTSGQGFIPFDEIKRKLPLPTSENELGRNRRPSLFIHPMDRVPRNEKFIRVLETEHLDADKRGRNHN